jgi:hypothetical protein
MRAPSSCSATRPRRCSWPPTSWRRSRG